MRTPKTLYRTSPTLFMCELSSCPQCEGPLSPGDYVTGRKTTQTMQEVLTIAYRPKTCHEKGCRAAGRALPSAAWQHLAPKYSTYGYDVIAHIGWERQTGRAPFEVIQARLRPHVQVSESMVRYLYHQKSLPLVACQERQHLAELKTLAHTQGLILGLDGLVVEGGEPQLWVIRELQTDLTLRCGWLSGEDEPTCVAFLQPIVDWDLPVRAVSSDKQRGLVPAVTQVFPQAQYGFCHAH
jgi:hypothetical protein